MELSNVEHIVYHGTEIKRGNGFIRNQRMQGSIGDRHWLGDGSYFYKDLFYTYKWISDMYKSRNGRKHYNYKELTVKYSILYCIITVNNERIFDLDENLDHKFLFDYFKNKIQEISKFKSKLDAEKNI